MRRKILRCRRSAEGTFERFEAMPPGQPNSWRIVAAVRRGSGYGQGLRRGLEEFVPPKADGIRRGILFLTCCPECSSAECFGGGFVSQNRRRPRAGRGGSCQDPCYRWRSLDRLHCATANGPERGQSSILWNALIPIRSGTIVPTAPTTRLARIATVSQKRNRASREDERRRLGGAPGRRSRGGRGGPGPSRSRR